MPKPKNALSMMPMAASSLVRVQRTTTVSSAMAINPLARAPSDRLSKSREPVITNARQTPGSEAWASMSPTSERRRSTAKLPATPAAPPSNAEPIVTLSMSDRPVIARPRDCASPRRLRRAA
jgi:hypothetical protein